MPSPKSSKKNAPQRPRPWAVSVTLRFKQAEQHALVESAARALDMSINKFVLKQALLAAAQVLRPGKANAVSATD